MRRAANIDRVHAEIVNALRGRGCTVQSLAAVGKGCPDLLVGWCGDNWLIEVKSFNVHRKKGQLSPEQKAWHEQWRGQVTVVRCLEDLGRIFPAVPVASASASAPCLGNDPLCPCQDGDACHYRETDGSPAMTIPRP